MPTRHTRRLFVQVEPVPRVVDFERVEGHEIHDTAREA
jgi:hypothetical protein